MATLTKRCERISRRCETWQTVYGLLGMAICIAAAYLKTPWLLLGGLACAFAVVVVTLRAVKTIRMLADDRS